MKHHLYRSLSSLFHDRHSREGQAAAGAPGPVARFNDKLAVRMTVIFGSIWCVYAFAVFSLIPVVAPATQSILLYVSNSIQLVALPALMVGNAILTRGSDQRATDDHAALLEILQDVRQEVAELRKLTGGIAQEQETHPELVTVANEAFISVNDGPDSSKTTIPSHS